VSIRIDKWNHANSYAARKKYTHIFKLNIISIIMSRKVALQIVVKRNSFGSKSVAANNISS
jgi:hypothetical protein